MLHWWLSSKFVKIDRCLIDVFFMFSIRLATDLQLPKSSQVRGCADRCAQITHQNALLPTFCRSRAPEGTSSRPVKLMPRRRDSWVTALLTGRWQQSALTKQCPRPPAQQKQQSPPQLSLQGRRCQTWADERRHCFKDRSVSRCIDLVAADISFD